VRRAFSIVELAVVMAVIAALAAMIATAISGSTGAARGASCTNHLRQFSVAAVAYSGDWEIYPPAIWWEQHDGVWREMAWDAVHEAGERVGDGVLWAYCDGSVHDTNCPELDGPVDVRDPSSGYNYNTDYLGAEASFLQGLEDARPGVAPAACRHPAQTAMFGDGGSISGDAAGFRTSRFMRAPVAEGDCLPCWGRQSYRHGGQTLVGWLDGHVGGVRTRAVDSCGECQDPSLFRDNGFLSENTSPYDPSQLIR
jgi:prepilin-type processing-associated H-X9-DG protein